MSWLSSRSSRTPGRFPWFLRRIITFIWQAALTIIIPLILLISWYVWQASHFDLSKVEDIPARTILLDRDGQEFDTVHGANRRLVTREDLPPFFVQCLFAREDARFMEHGGVDLRGLARATIRNVKDLDFTQGASTLTMQLARNSFDLREKKSLNRKFLEIALTYRIESKYDKDEILTHYLNRIYFGSGCYGLGEASLTYFGIPAKQLNRNQAAMLAGIIRGPHAFSPLRNLEGALAQRNEVLTRLETTGEISFLEQHEIKEEPLNSRKNAKSLSQTSHAARALRRPLEIALDRSQITVGGLRVTSTISSKVQQELESLFNSLNLSEDCQTAAIAIAPETGDILGIVGNRGAKPTGFNRALDSYRGLGATMIEPFINTSALERGHLPISGKPVVTARQLSEKDALQLLKRFGFNKSFGSGDDLYRGTMTASPKEIALGLATIINDGKRPTSRFIIQVEEAGKTLFKLEPELFPAFSKGSTPKKIPSILVGTSPSKADLWGALISKEKVIVAWAGKDQPTKLDFLDEASAALHKALEKLEK